MAHVRKDTLANTVQWWKHLRPFWKRRIRIMMPEQ